MSEGEGRYPRAWLLLDVDRWWDGRPCVDVLFSRECPAIPGSIAVGSIELVEGKLERRLGAPLMNRLQRKVWDAVIAWVEEELLSGFSASGE
ncbi:hypothetical protein SAMN00808754_1431 [Thermanaeromonas toyohensis ToBE]|uniref:Uncharacterized protein n=1 Tax=Thermanaeromonas toyohensis ToBE TaxID=698762 RepID=A0A1W1VTM1_9FIRM|nr:hypothetical protein [Thermanaeromonas toyohensis]SMB96234.1 hypothetical protein SAMN00808754_1431 [Thermanaeromonas toyohensis ToBE]